MHVYTSVATEACARHPSGMLMRQIWVRVQARAGVFDVVDVAAERVAEHLGWQSAPLALQRLGLD